MPGTCEAVTPEFNRFRLGGYDEFRIRRAAHSVNRSRGASSHGILVASGPLGDDGNRPVRTAHDRAIGRIERRGSSKVEDEARVFGGALPGYRSSAFHAERHVSLSVGNVRRSGCGITTAAFHTHRASAGSRTAGSVGVTQAPRIGLRANVLIVVVLVVSIQSPG